MTKQELLQELKTNYIQPQLKWNQFELQAKLLIGQQFGNIIILGINPIRRNSQLQLDVCCIEHPEIGVYQVLKGNVISGNTKGCYKCAPVRGYTANIKHGLSSSHEYYTFNRILNGIKDKNNKCYPRYGGRGIDLDPRYDPDFNNQGKEIAFINFINDLKELNIFPIPKGYQLDRIDNNKGYWKDNLRLATPAENVQNRECNTVNPDIVRLIRKDHSTGQYTHEQLGNKYNCSKQTIYEIVNYRQWKNII